MLITILRFLIPAFDFVWNDIRYPKLVYKRRFIAEIFYRYIPLTFFFVWLFSLIPIIGSELYIVFMLLGGYYIYKIRSGKVGLNDALFYFVVMNFGFLGIRSFFGHTFLADSVAQSIGWATGSMFQTELAFYHLGVAIATLLLIWIRSRDLLLGIIVIKSTFLFGALGVHMYEVIANNNFSSGNIGTSIIYADLIIPLIVITLFIKSKSFSRNDNNGTKL